jgi:aerobic-type carbon monoxide dehydrogenase small subunit (CoxS/CutS family)
VAGPLAFVVDGRRVEVPDDGCSLLEALRDRLGIRSPKDGCSPQGQCGCCTVLVDGQPRVACVTAARRVVGRQITTVDGLEDGGRWAEAFTAAGASQCGFCTPGIIVRLAGATARGPLTETAVDQALLAHLCRCTGWQTIREAAFAVARGEPAEPGGRRSADDAAWRARLEGRASQVVGADVALGRGGFADDAAPLDALVAVRSIDGAWVVGETLTAARAAAAKVQGRRTTAPLRWPIEVPAGEWARTLCTTWVEPGYLETDASWCVPGGEPATALANGGAFGGKVASEVGAVARRLADEHGRPVRVLFAREDAVRWGPKRPPLAAGVRADGRGAVRVARTTGIAAAIASAASGLQVEEVDVAGPPTSAAVRAAGWAEAAVLLASLGDGPDTVRSPGGAEATATIAGDGHVNVTVRCGRALDAVVLRSYCIGAAHMALGWVRSEGIAVDGGEPLDLTIRSFGILRAVDTPPIEVTIEDDDREPVNGSDAVFAAVAAAAWRALGFPERWPAR